MRSPSFELFNSVQALSSSPVIIGVKECGDERRTDGEANVKYPAGETYAFGFRAVQDKAPRAPGVYGIFTSRRWLYVGESDDIRRSLFERLNDPDPGWSAEHRPLSFSFETAPIVGSRRATAAPTMEQFPS
jgi:hypothetical protein